MTITSEQAVWFADTFGKLTTNVEKAVLGKRKTVQLALTCLLSDGHLLLEDVPGTGKTMLAKALANTVQGTQTRIQFSQRSFWLTRSTEPHRRRNRRYSK
jgi:MoxR-like ATPase